MGDNGSNVDGDGRDMLPPTNVACSYVGMGGSYRLSLLMLGGAIAVVLCEVPRLGRPVAKIWLRIFNGLT